MINLIICFHAILIVIGLWCFLTIIFYRNRIAIYTHFIFLALFLGSLTVYSSLLFIKWSQLSLQVEYLEDIDGALLPFFWLFLFFVLIDQNYINELKENEMQLKSSNDAYLAVNEELRTTIETIQQINEDLQIAEEKASASDKLKSAFLANLSHEIRTPMNAILGFSDILDDTELHVTDQKKYLAIIKESGNKLLTIIDNLVEISKIELGQVTINNNTIELETLLTVLFNNQKASFESKNLTFILSMPKNEKPVTLIVDNEKLHVVLINLLSNSLKHTNKGKVEFGYYIENENACLFVKDTGEGIPKDMHSKVFDRFIQVYTDDNMFVSGSGIGLTISKAYVENMGGTIELDSQLQIGTTVIVRLPIS